MFIIKRFDQGGGYLARPGCPAYQAGHAYTPNLRDAMVFRTYDEAAAEKCLHNEIIFEVDDAGGRPFVPLCLC